ncbi:hypothetical protein HPB51_024893 [Rhipicephalus microplus]|uniref:Uncharacterized protein n=1 Tax=Rhipicephalus microplus TaxID=6941 RepID=A0A9J6EQ48_RHIMP|nr:hypothetical protein HPB51_024893 [Rhipicephalus microplus]
METQRPALMVTPDVTFPGPLIHVASYTTGSWQVIPTVIVPKRKMRKKQKPKHSFGFESTSSGPDNKPSSMETELQELLVHFWMTRESPHAFAAYRADEMTRTFWNVVLKESSLFSNCSRRSCYLRCVYDRKPTARTSAPGSSPSSPEPDHIQVIPTFIVPKRKMGKKQKTKHSFGFESTSRGPDNKPSNKETELLELLVHFRMQQESCHGEYDISSSKSAEGEHEFKADEVFDHETRRPKLTKQGAVDIMTQLRDFSRENGPSEEHDLRKALSISEVQMILDMHGTTTVFLDRRVDGDNKPATRRTENASSQIPSLHLHHFRTLQVMQKTSDAKLKRRPDAIPESQAQKPQQNYDKIRADERTTPRPDLVPPRTTAKVNVTTSKKDRKNRSTHEPGAQASSQELKRRPFSNPSPPHQPKAEQKPRVLPVRQTPSLISLSPPRRRQILEKKHGFPNGLKPRPRPRATLETSSTSTHD